MLDFSDSNNIDIAILEYEIECAEALKRLKIQSSDTTFFEEGLNRELSPNEQRKFGKYTDDVATANKNLLNKVSKNKPDKEEITKKDKVHCRVNLKLLKKDLDEETKDIEKNKKIVFDTSDATKKIKTKTRDASKFLVKNKDTLMDTAVVYNDLQKAEVSSRNMKAKFDNASASYRKATTTEQRAAAKEATDQFIRGYKMYNKLFNDAYNDLK